jgi:enterochelin esterase-like enzyme
MPTATPQPTPSPTPELVLVETLAIDSELLTNAPRIVDVYLPPGYAADPERRYPVVYAQDGQDMDDVRLKATLEELYSQGALAPLIVIAIHATGERMSEYGTAGTPDYQYRGNHADLYTRMLFEEIMPRINENYRTLTGPENTSVMGWSLGGLMAFDLAWNHPEAFGQVGVFSGSFWWHTENEDLQTMLDSRVAHMMVREGEKRDGMRFWFETGFHDETDDRDGDGIIDAVQDTRELVAELRAKGYTDADIAVVELPDGFHSQSTWAEVLPDFLVWASPRQ